MFTAIKGVFVLGASFMLARANVSYGQSASQSAAEKGYITIEAGDCAQFVWTVGSRVPRLVSATQGTFGFTPQSGPVTYTEVSRSNSDEYAGWTQKSYDVAAKLLFKLDLASPVKVEDTLLYDGGALTIRNEDGRLTTENVKAVLSCNRFGEVSDIGFDAVTQKFKMPYWLEVPAGVQEERRAQRSAAQSVKPMPELTAEMPLNEEIEVSAPSVQALPIEDVGPSYVVQLAAFRVEAQVFEHLNMVRNLVPYIDGYAPEVQTSALEDIGTVYRLRLTGISEKIAAIALCDRLKTDGVDCYIPPTP